MIKQRMFLLGAVLVGASLIAACGGGGGGAAPASGTPTQAVLTLKTTGSVTAAGVDGIGGIDVTVILPAGATLKDPATHADVVVPAGSWQLPLGGIYTAATGTFPGTVRVAVYYGGLNGLPTGTFATVVCDLTGTTPAAGDFTIDAATAVVSGVTGSSVTPITSWVTPTVSAHFQ